MRGGCTYPIYYQGVVSLENGSVIIRYKLPELIKKVSQVGNPAVPQAGRSHVSSMTMVRSRTLLTHSHVLSMTVGCTCSIYYQGVVSLEKGSAIIRYKLPELTKKLLRGRTPLSSFQA